MLDISKLIHKSQSLFTSILALATPLFISSQNAVTPPWIA